MKQISAQYTNKAVDSHDGLSNKECPLCGRVVRELDMEEYDEEGSERSLECCNGCREDFESDSGLEIESDTLAQDVFASFWKFSQEAIESKFAKTMSDGLTEENADAVAEILGGESWQSGGGIMVIMFRRKDGRLTVLSDNCVCEYASKKDFDENNADKVIPFC